MVLTQEQPCLVVKAVDTGRLSSIPAEMHSWHQEGHPAEIALIL